MPNWNFCLRTSKISAWGDLISRYFIYILTYIRTKTYVINCQIGCISWNICRMWYCCKFIFILQELCEIEKEYGIKKSLHGPCTISHGPNNFHSIAYTTTDATVSTHRHTVRVAPYMDRVRRFWKQFLIWKEVLLKEGWSNGDISEILTSREARFTTENRSRVWGTRRLAWRRS